MVFDAKGRAVEGLKAQESYEPDSSEPGQATFDADWLVECASRCIDGALQEASSRGSRIGAVGVTTFWHSMLGVDDDGRPVTPLITWADTRAAHAAETLKQSLDPSAYHRRTGCALHPSFYPARLHWLAAEPETYARVRKWMSPGEYLFLRLFGRAACSVSMASATGLFHQNEMQWDGETLRAIGLAPEHLLDPTDIDEPAAGLWEPYRSRWPILADIPWAPAIGDGAASNLGSGCSTDRRIAINLGTSGAIRVLFEAEQVEIPDDLWCYRLDRRRRLMGGAFSDGGNILTWARETLAGVDDALVEEAASRAPDSHGLTFLPFLGGERSTGWRPHARGTIHSLSLQTAPVDLLQAGMEAVALRFALVHRSLKRVFPKADEIVVSGGAFSRAPGWAQMTADALGAPLLLAEETEATSRGAALVALSLLGITVDDSRLSGRTLEPRMDRHDVLCAALDRQQRLYYILSEFNGANGQHV
jgi:gluconokinase